MGLYGVVLMVRSQVILSIRNFAASRASATNGDIAFLQFRLSANIISESSNFGDFFSKEIDYFGDTSATSATLRRNFGDVGDKALDFGDNELDFHDALTNFGGNRFTFGGHVVFGEEVVRIGAIIGEVAHIAAAEAANGEQFGAKWRPGSSGPTSATEQVRIGQDRWRRKQPQAKSGWFNRMIGDKKNENGEEVKRRMGIGMDKES